VTADRITRLLGPRLADIEARGLYRRRRVVEAAGPAGRLVVDGRSCTGFCSNDYLGLAQDPRIAEAFAKAARATGAGSGASHLVTGHHREHHHLEEVLAAFTGRERALAFSTGYMANLGLARALAGPGDAVFEDRLNHASLLDAGRLAGAEFVRFGHANAAALDAALGEHPRGLRLVLTDGVFSMDGDLAPLPDVVAACERHDALLAVDDAHGLGVIGPTGRGIVEHFGLGAVEVPALVGTLGKAFGSFGAFVAGDEALVEYLIQRARTYIYTTALPPAVAAATRRALEIAEAEPWRRERVLAHAERFRRLAAAAGIELIPSDTPIQPVVLGEPLLAMAASTALLERGYLVTAIRPPTVPPGTSRLRVTFSAAHQDSDVDRLVAALAEVLASLPAEPAQVPARHG
jgi:8-amino-7-oxononanoate synthase